MKSLSEIARTTGEILQSQTSTESPALTASESGTLLPELYDKVFPKATPQDWAMAQSLMETSFGTITEGRGYPEWSDQQKWAVFRSLAEEDNWSGKRLEAQIKHFLRTHKYPTWKPADIYAVHASRLYPYSWAKQQYAEGNGLLLEAYRVPGVQGLMYRLADGRELPFEKVTLGAKPND